MADHSDPFQGKEVASSIMLTVGDVNVSREFYVRYFRLQVTEQMEGFCRLQRPGISLYLTEESPPTVDKPSVTLAKPPDRNRPSTNLIFHVPDVKSAYHLLVESGMKFLAPPHSPEWGGWRCFAQDPDGYLMEIEQA